MPLTSQPNQAQPLDPNWAQPNPLSMSFESIQYITITCGVLFCFLCGENYKLIIYNYAIIHDETR